ncbi:MULTISPECIES: 3-deoxy-manno-octulosonate cytidylyltransferase [unclassified Candidatus Frackibacter]|uniref:3-deoxy-manno-octulosonate cytidylyltransferase n=1 Tax=unclassified Candidatus Frackibacter TaxID=2648818 RepID=UPI0008902ECD|nr:MULTISPECIES: 3-deoxy-manno-octulosonate cytidylyltransferase [unclassified Candidatus Frackibacter]SDC09372.1 3-deoxy-manno-octulosonate cytidylyltransferase (CMP-KDO synthetase) [Candidatus Frackibacter sp. WG11]SEM37824.1 3-deoxy-manno-octulosonate cytidylyltransferase (CMP-KDO synthetase) [Candidatus Frackibacter sp. WG12]SFL43276.1 3-deoxy-manno-octulosonate cytidylyltransferase (CMP-KDO synthetase) [Candidatus Frackibacter sp. WG13]
MESKRVVGIIPARYASTRLPGKPLVDIRGKPMVQHVYERTSKAAVLDEVVVATDDERIKEAVLDFGGEVVMTSKNHQTGTDRLAEAARDIEADVIVNVQGDEPLIAPEMIEEAVRPLLNSEEVVMGTLKKRIKDLTELKNSNLVKVVTDQNDYALYFSRAPIPFLREDREGIDFYKHIGLYAYQKKFLLDFAQMESTTLEQMESLEQLRALENGYRIKVVETKYSSIGVDTEEDLVKVREMMEEIQNG